MKRPETRRNEERQTDLQKILDGDRLSIGRAITIAEEGGREAADLLKRVFPHTGRALTLGITGSPGAGKSTLVDRLAAYYRAAGKKVGIVAVDPSSPFTGGALLGDRIRMQKMATDPGVFIRSMAARGFLGGISRATGDAVAILDAAGYNTILVETVGVGQDEVEIVKTADVTVVVLVPGMGDDIQAIKAGIMEIGDVFVINKADRDGVLRTEHELQSLLSISERRDGWTVPIVKTVATQDSGIRDLADAAAAYEEFARSHPEQAEIRRTRVAQFRVIDLLRDRLLKTVMEKFVTETELREMAQAIAARRRDPYSVVDELAARLKL